MCLACMRIALAGSEMPKLEPEWPDMAPAPSRASRPPVGVFAAVEVAAAEVRSDQHRRGDVS